MIAGAPAIEVENLGAMDALVDFLNAIWRDDPHAASIIAFLAALIHSPRLLVVFIRRASKRPQLKAELQG